MSTTKCLLCGKDIPQFDDLPFEMDICLEHTQEEVIEHDRKEIQGYIGEHASELMSCGHSYSSLAISDLGTVACGECEKND